MNIVFEFTSRNTPQHNYLADIGFPIVMGNARAMLADANIPTDIRSKVLPVTQLGGLVVAEIDGVSATRYVHFFGRNPPWAHNLRTFGEAELSTTKYDHK